jgi:hypothetical protein
VTRATRISLVAGGVMVAALVAGLLVLMNRGPRRERTPAKRATPNERADDRPTGAPARGDVRPVGRVASTAPEGDGGEPAATDSRDAGATATVVREHEPGEYPRRPSAIVPSTVAQIRAEANPYVKNCSEPMRGGDPQTRERIQVTAMVSSAGGRVVVHDPIVRAKDTVPADVIECVKKSFEQLSFAAPVGQGDGEQKVHLPFMVP